MNKNTNPKTNSILFLFAFKFLVKKSKIKKIDNDKMANLKKKKDDIFKLS